MNGFKHVLRGIVVVVVLNCFCIDGVSAASSDPEFYYYSGNKKNALNVSTMKVAVKFKENIGLEKREQVVNAHANLEPFSKRQEISKFKLTLIPVREGKTKDTVIQTVNRLTNKSEVEIALPVFEVENTELMATDEFIVKFKPSVSQEDIYAFNELNGVEIARKPKWTDRFTLKLKDPKSKSVFEVANLYYENPITVFSMPNFIRKMEPMSTTPDDTYFSNQWHLKNTAQSPPGGTAGADIDATEGWDIQTGSPDIVIAIIDEGVDINHEDLADNVVDGYDFVDDDTNATPSGNDAHGTACAGLAAGVTNNDKGIAGVAWDCKIMPIRVAYVAGRYWVTSDEWLSNGIEWASDNGADVLSNSWGGGPDSDTIHDAIKEAKNNGRNGKGCVVVFSSGNGGSGVSYPARYSEVIAVGATDEVDVRWSYSNYGNELDVVAPSSDGLSTIFWTTDITGNAGDNSGSTSQGDAAGNYTKWFSGTSAAAPQVAGLAGLILSSNPSLTSNEVQEIIETTADDKGDSGWDQYYGWGRINIYEALYEVSILYLSVDDGVGEGDCVLPDNYIEYTVSYYNPITDPDEAGYLGDIDNITIVSELSEWVDFDSIPFGSGSYDDPNHVVRWTVSKLSPGESDFIYIKVKVNDQAVPLEDIINYVELTSDTVFSWAEEKTPVCCFGSEVVYVDAELDVPDPNGASWETAFKDLNDALAAARVCDEIWVGDGTYQPTTNPANTNKRFFMQKGINVYGGFVGGEDSRDERDWSVNESILSGFIDSLGNDPNRVDYVVVADPNNPFTILDGFTITGAKNAGVLIDNTTAAILHNKISDSGKGVYCLGAEKLIIRNNWLYQNDYGIYCRGAEKLIVENNWLYQNDYGIYGLGTEKPIIKNNWLYRNDYGIYLNSPVDIAKVHNNTIADNTIAGLYLNGGIAPEVTNCIFTGHPWDKDLIGCPATYSYIEYPPGGGTGNVDGDPNYPPYVTGTDDYHITLDSGCVDAGDANGVYDGQRDIDKQFRVLDGDGDGEAIVDMGADEYCDEGGSNDADFSNDGIVDYFDFVTLADAWLTSMDIVDLQEFANEWLWMSCDYMRDIPIPDTSEQMFMSAVSMSFTQAIPSAPEPTTAERIAQAEDAIKFLESIWEEDEELRDQYSQEYWDDFIGSIEDWIDELEAGL